MLKKLAAVFDPRKLPKDEFTPLFESLEKDIASRTDTFYERLPLKDCEDYSALKALPPEKKLK